MEKTVSHLKNLDYSVVQQCMHCGMCLPTCPTYDITKMERNSPRGRIALMRSIADGDLEVTPFFGEEMYYCLGCLACTTACPAGVNYAELLERARAEVEAQRVLANPKRNFVRKWVIGWLFMDLKRLRFMGWWIRFYQQLGLQSLFRALGLMKLLPKKLQAMESLTPPIQPKYSYKIISETTPAVGGKKYRVAMLVGCAQDLIFSDVNRDTVEVLAQNGCEVHTPHNQSCCGSLHAHNGEWNLAGELARRNINQFNPNDYDAIITNAGGCGSHLKRYSSLLEGDEAYQKRAHAWDAKVKDIHEWLDEIGIKPPRSNGVLHNVTYHESCHLCHGQKITHQPRKLLRSIPGVNLTELPESDWCCGSAGVYNITQPEMANQLLGRKVEHIKRTNAQVIATGNPGCLLQVQHGCRRKGMSVRVIHPVTLLAEAYRKENN
ncbi:MAG: (Fe-S)-binding protein [Verrucomicrobiota bacterium]|jgi:glycolate oxidase iron-sulfur subunit|nr:(Fe-S)-binding protein [Verrucomicrobiota bacterium]